MRSPALAVIGVIAVLLGGCSNGDDKKPESLPLPAERTAGVTSVLLEVGQRSFDKEAKLSGVVAGDGGHVYVAWVLDRDDEATPEQGRVFDIPPEGAPKLVAADFVPTGLTYGYGRLHVADARSRTVWAVSLATGDRQPMGETGPYERRSDKPGPTQMGLYGSPSLLSLSIDDFLFVADSRLIYTVHKDRAVLRLAGSVAGEEPKEAPETAGDARDAVFAWLKGLAVRPRGSEVYVSDRDTIRQINTDGRIVTVASRKAPPTAPPWTGPGQPFPPYGTPDPPVARLTFQPGPLAFDEQNALYVAEADKMIVHRFDGTGEQIVLDRHEEYGSRGVYALTVSTAGDLYVIPEDRDRLLVRRAPLPGRTEGKP